MHRRTAQKIGSDPRNFALRYLCRAFDHDIALVLNLWYHCALYLGRMVSYYANRCRKKSKGGDVRPRKITKLITWHSPDLLKHLRPAFNGNSIFREVLSLHPLLIGIFFIFCWYLWIVIPIPLITLPIAIIIIKEHFPEAKIQGLSQSTRPATFQSGSGGSGEQTAD